MSDSLYRTSIKMRGVCICREEERRRKEKGGEERRLDSYELFWS